MANSWGGWTPPRHSGTWVGARVASLRCHYPPPRRSQYSRNAEARLHKSKTSCRGGHRRGTTTSGPGRGPLAGFEVTFYGRFSGDRRGVRPWESGKSVFGFSTFSGGARRGGGIRHFHGPTAPLSKRRRNRRLHSASPQQSRLGGAHLARIPQSSVSRIKPMTEYAAFVVGMV